jgi:predicted  nucleic acid-binding Zn-ribbon protein
MIISRGFNPSETIYIENDEEVTRLENEVGELTYEISELRNELGDLRRLYQLAAAKLIEQLAETKEQQIEYAQTYNDVLTEVKKDLQ